MPHNDAIKDATERLLRDPDLPGRLAGRINTSLAAARKSHPRGHAAIDAERAGVMAAIVRLTGAEQLLALETAVERFETLAAEAEAERQRQDALARREMQDRRVAALREAHHQAWADKTTAPTLGVIHTLGDHLARSKEQLSGIRSEIALRETIVSLADALKVANAALAAEAQASIRRADEAEKKAA